MCSVQEMQRIDRELSSELVESPINPAFLHMSVPLINGYTPLFYLQFNGEALWEWRKLRSPSQLFDTQQNNLSRITGYRLSSSSLMRIGIAVYSRVEYIANKLRNTKISSQRRPTLKSQYWCFIAVHPTEIVQDTAEVINGLKKNEELLIQENQRLKDELEGKNFDSNQVRFK